MLTMNQEIKRLEALLNGEAVEGLRLNDPGISYKWVIERIANLRTLQNAKHERAQREALSAQEVNPLDVLVETILDVALEEHRDDAAITIRDLIYKDAIPALRSGEGGR